MVGVGLQTKSNRIGIFSFNKGNVLSPDGVIAISAQAISAWSWARGHVGKWFLGQAERGLGLNIKCKVGFLPLLVHFKAGKG